MVRPRDAGSGDLLLCELHCHSTWSDGALAIPELVDLYGRSGFDVLCVTDHVVHGDNMVTAERFDAYLEAIRREALRARAAYGLVLIPGLELTWDDPDETRAAHAVAIGVDRFVTLDDGLDRALAAAARQRAAIVAVHPHSLESDPTPGRTTRRWWIDRELRRHAHRFELINRDQVFPWVAADRLAAVASGDFHRPEHLETWKTLLPARRDARAVIDYLRSPLPAFLTRHSTRTVAARAPDPEVVGFPV